MKIIVDANIIFSSLISGSSIYLKILSNIEAYSPDFLLLEIEKYEKRILTKTKNKKLIKKVLYKIFKEITIIPKIGISKNSFKSAYQLCKDIDEKDTPYLALTIELDGLLWTNDKKLIKGLREKNFKNVITTQEILNKIEVEE